MKRQVLRANASNARNFDWLAHPQYVASIESLVNTMRQEVCQWLTRGIALLIKNQMRQYRQRYTNPVGVLFRTATEHEEQGDKLIRVKRQI
jgi:hypothetical protein